MNRESLLAEPPVRFERDCLVSREELEMLLRENETEKERGYRNLFGRSRRLWSFRHPEYDLGSLQRAARDRDAPSGVRVPDSDAVRDADLHGAGTVLPSPSQAG